MKRTIITKRTEITKIRTLIGGVLLLSIFLCTGVPAQASVLSVQQTVAAQEAPIQGASEEVPVMISQTTENHIPGTLIAGGVIS